jgi:hypothetical protein
MEYSLSLAYVPHGSSRNETIKGLVNYVKYVEYEVSFEGDITSSKLCRFGPLLVMRTRWLSTKQRECAQYIQRRE